MRLARRIASQDCTAECEIVPLQPIDAEQNWVATMAEIKGIGSFDYTVAAELFPRAVARETGRWATGVLPKPLMPSDLQSKNCRPNFS